MGIRGFRFVDHGAWADPEIVWHGYAMNVHYVEDAMWEMYCEQCRDEGLGKTDDGFVRFCKVEVEKMRELAQMTIDYGNAERIKRVRFGKCFPSR